MLSGAFHGSTCINQLTLCRNTCNIHSLQYGTCYILAQQSLISFKATKNPFYVIPHQGDGTLCFPRESAGKTYRKVAHENKEAGVTCRCPKGQPGEFILPLSFLPSFLSVWPKFDSSPLISISCRCPGSSPHLSSSLSIHLSSPIVPFTPPLSFSRLSSCHFAPFSVPVPLRFFSPYLCNFLTRPPTPVCLCFAANVCDEEMLLCQNGGTCFQNQKCICPPEFKGVLCQQSRCEAGKDCNAASSLRPATLLICTLLAHMLAMLTPH